MREGFVVVTEEGNLILFIDSCQRTLKKNIPCGTQQAVLKLFFTRVAKYLKDNKHIRLYFSFTIFRISEQIISTDRYPYIFSAPNRDYCLSSA